MGRGSAPIKSKLGGIRHLQDHDSAQDLYFILKDHKSFRTWTTTGLRGRSRDDYYRTFRFTEPGQLSDPFRQLFLDHAAMNVYTVFLGDSPIAWYHAQLGWIAPKLEGFADTHTLMEWEKAYNAILAITGKGYLA